MSTDPSRSAASPPIGLQKSADEDLLFVDEPNREPAPASAHQPAPTKSSSLSRPSYALTLLAPNRAPRGFVYVPVWDAFHKILSTYLCMPVAPLGPRQALFGHQSLPKGASDVERAEFDKRTFDQAVETASKLQREKSLALVGICIDYHSLSNGKARDILLAGFRTLPKSLSQLITVEIGNTPDHIPTTTLGERIQIVRPYFRSVALQLPSLTHGASRFSYMGLHALVYRLWDWPHDEKPLDVGELAAYTKQAKAQHLHFGFAGVPDMALAQKLTEIGATYLGGPFLGPALDAPAGMRRCSLEEIAAQRKA